jgi:hypothetical protein
MSLNLYNSDLRIENHWKQRKAKTFQSFAKSEKLNMNTLRNSIRFDFYYIFLFVFFSHPQYLVKKPVSKLLLF